MRWGDVSVSLLPDTVGGPSYFVAQVTDITEHKKTDQAMQAIVRGVRHQNSKQFFAIMAQQLADSLDADSALIGELTEDSAHTIRTLGVWVNGAPGPELVYPLAGTPCEKLFEKCMCSYSSGVAGLFPRDIMLRETGAEAFVAMPLCDSQENVLGMVSVIYTRPLENPRFTESILQLFSTRIAAEIERLRAEQALQKR